MRHMKKALFLAAVCCMAVSGCGKQEEEAPEKNTEPTEQLVETETAAELIPLETEEAVVDDANKNPLTGEAMDAALAAQRPVSCMIGNTTDAMPQYGIADADVIVEAPAAEAEKVRALVKEEMESAASLAVPMEVDAKTGKDWGEAH